MRTTTLGSNGPEVGVIGLGCMGMSYAYDMAADRDDTSISVIRQAIDLGVTLIDTADAYGTPAQVALAWVVAQGRYVVPIPGTKTPKYLLDNVGAGDLQLSHDGLAELDAMPAPTGNRL